MTGETASTYHARLEGLTPEMEYVDELLADGADAVRGSFRTAPTGRAPSRFTRLGDQSIPAKVRAGLAMGSVDAQANGDLCYANVSDDPVET